jgi:predicted O-methyltransferase YrrM
MWTIASLPSHSDEPKFLCSTSLGNRGVMTATEKPSASWSCRIGLKEFRDFLGSGFSGNALSRAQGDSSIHMVTTRVDSTNNASHDALVQHYRNEGLPDEAWHIGPEHPALERVALEVLESRVSCHVLEIGFQAGGFAVPIILALHRDPRFQYTGVDNLAYTNSVRPATIESFLRSRVTPGCYEFIQLDSTRFLKTVPPASIDLVLLDHFKPLYERDLLVLCRRGIVKSGGVVLLHDVHSGAARAWRNCNHLVRTFGLEVDLRAEVPAGLAILRIPSDVRPRRFKMISSCAITAGRVAKDDAILHTRRAVGRFLRRVGLRS